MYSGCIWPADPGVHAQASRVDLGAKRSLYGDTGADQRSLLRPLRLAMVHRGRTDAFLLGPAPLITAHHRLVVVPSYICVDASERRDGDVLFSKFQLNPQFSGKGKVRCVVGLYQPGP